MSETDDTMWDGKIPSAEAAKINRERHVTYGDPTPNMEMLANLWSSYLGVRVSAEDASLMLVLLKVMREKQSGFNADYPDNSIDICGWTNVLHQVKEAHRGG